MAGEPAAALAVSARYADLCIVSQGGSKVGRRCIAGNASRSRFGERPVLVVPFTGAPLPVGKRILIAWSGSREAARALGDSLPFLARAEEVHVLTISELGSREPQAYDVARYLARHGLRVETHAVSQGEFSAATVILNTADDLGSDLLVMGCYGHTRLREALFGGVTRAMLRSMTVPILMSS